MGSLADDELPRGTMVERYVILDVIGRGGMGVVYAAYDTQLERKLAIKLLRRELARGIDSGVIESRLLREAQAMARLTHPNVVTVHDVGTFDRRVFLAMEFVDGVTLTEWLKTERPLRERLDVLRAAGRGLAAAHAAGLVHRDFKPDNVLVGRDGRVLVTDFGIARAAGERLPEPEEPIPIPPSAKRDGARLDAPLTMTGSLLGTVGYLAPEQGYGEAGTNAATDQFSYAVTAYLAVYGERPFPGDTVESYLTAIERPVRDPPKGSRVPSWIRRILLRGLARDPASRFPSLAALLDALDHDPAARWKRAAWGLAALLVVATGIAAGALVVRHRDAECAADPSDLDGVWSASIADDVRRAFEATAVPGAANAASRATRKIDEYVAKWTAMRSDVCRATRVRKAQPEDVYRLRMDCLDRERTELRSVASMLARADAQVVKKSLDVAYGLPDVAWCANVATLRASAGLPDDPAKREKVLAVRARLAEVDALYLAGKFTDAAARAHPAVEAAREVNHPPTTADALFMEGRVRGYLGDFGEAYPILRESTWLATSSGTDATAVLAASWSAYVGVKLHRTDEAHLWLDAARASLGRIGAGASPALELDVLDSEGVVVTEGDGHPEQAVAMDQRLVDAYRKQLGASPRTSVAIYNLASDHSYLGELALARPLYEEALAMNVALCGDSCERTGVDEYALGDCLVGLGALDEGEAMLARALAILEANGATYWIADTLEALARARLARGDARGALAYAERARSLTEKAPATELAPRVLIARADALTALGRAGEALPLCDQAIALQEADAEIDPSKPYGWDALRCRAEALLALGRARDAIAPLERSLGLPRRMYPGDYARVQRDLERAHTAAH